MDLTAPAERWLPVPGYEGYYEVSDQGRVRSLDRRLPYRNGTRMHRGRLLVGGRSPDDGRRLVQLAHEGGHSWPRVSVLVLEAFVGPRPAGMYACHNNGDATDDRLENLRWDTPSGNTADCLMHGNHWQALKDKCPRGHLLREPNLVRSILGRGHRNCLACTRARDNARYARKTGRSVDLDVIADDHYARIMEGQRDAAA